MVVEFVGLVNGGNRIVFMVKFVDGLMLINLSVDEVKVKLVKIVG